MQSAFFLDTSASTVASMLDLGFWSAILSYTIGYNGVLLLMTSSLSLVHVVSWFVCHIRLVYLLSRRCRNGFAKIVLIVLANSVPFSEQFLDFVLLKLLLLLTFKVKRTRVRYDVCASREFRTSLIVKSTRGPFMLTLTPGNCLRRACVYRHMFGDFTHSTAKHNCRSP